jgi:hypothetical protein
MMPAPVRSRRSFTIEVVTTVLFFLVFFSYGAAPGRQAPWVD